MNCCFYEAIARLPLGTVGAIEFLGPIALAAVGLRTPRNLAALIAAAAGVYLLTDVRIAGEPLGFLFAFANCALFVLYIVLGHRIAADGGTAGIDRLARRDADRGGLLVSDRDSRMRGPRSPIRCCSAPRSASAFRRRSFPTSAISSRWRGCRARPSR